MLQGQLSSLDEVNTSVRHAHRADGWFNLAWAYLTIAFANAVFQGLLNIHVLLDNPYGDHCTKFPLRAQIVELLNASRTMLSFTDQLPCVVADIFAGRDTHPRAAEVPIETCTETASVRFFIQIDASFSTRVLSDMSHQACIACSFAVN